jgi:uncharacterized membrane protein YeiH
METFQHAFEVLAVIFAALSGIVDSRRKDLDAVGAFVVGLTTAFGGGTIRDVLLDRRPLFWVERPAYPAIVLVLALLYLYAPKWMHPLRHRPVQRVAELLDALALGLFGGLGTQAAIETGVPHAVAVLFGVITGTFGGVLRDIVLNEVPLLFRPSGQLYATAVFAGGALQAALVWQGAQPSVALIAGAVVTIGVRLISMAFGLRLPPARHFDD